jgi:hypothetical protein
VAHSQSLSLSQQSYHEAAMGDLGTPVTEVGSPAVLDGIEDLDAEEEEGEEQESPSLCSGTGGCRGACCLPAAAGGVFSEKTMAADRK